MFRLTTGYWDYWILGKTRVVTKMSIAIFRFNNKSFSSKKKLRGKNCELRGNFFLRDAHFCNNPGFYFSKKTLLSQYLKYLFRLYWDYSHYSPLRPTSRQCLLEPLGFQCWSHGTVLLYSFCCCSCHSCVKQTQLFKLLCQSPRQGKQTQFRLLCQSPRQGKKTQI